MYKLQTGINEPLYDQRDKILNCFELFFIHTTYFYIFFCFDTINFKISLTF